jgi:hypothetical protein
MMEMKDKKGLGGGVQEAEKQEPKRIQYLVQRMKTLRKEKRRG